MDTKATGMLMFGTFMVLMCSHGGTFVNGHTRSHDLKTTFEKTLHQYNINGYTYGISTDDTLVVAEGKGQIRGHAAHARTLLPVLGISKLFTAVAVLQLVEDEVLSMTDRVFGNHGILYYVRTERESHMDPRLRDITIRDLLYHTAGWDETKGPVYDPMLNAFYVRNGYDVIDISRDMNVYGILSYDDIMRFMVTQPLHYEPGAKRTESNFGYILLGRVIEEVTEMTYEDYVREHILQPVGMWHTRIGPSYSDTHQAQDGDHEPGRPPKMGYIPLDASRTKSLFDIVPPLVLDSCLGWHSNIYDLSRFFTALFQDTDPDDNLLTPATVDELILEPGYSPEPDVPVWDGIGVGSNYNGEIWFHSFHPDIGVNVAFYHRKSPYWNEAAHASISTDISVVMLAVAAKPIHGLVEEFVSWSKDGDIESLSNLENVIIEDLADISVQVEDDQLLVAEHLDEHHLLEYLDALRMADFVPSWLQGYMFGGHTKFAVISRKAKLDADLDFVVLRRRQKDQMVSAISNEIKNGYQLSSLQSYLSAAHEDGLSHLALLRKGVDTRLVEFEISTDLDTYYKHMKDGFSQGLLPKVQSVDVADGNVTITYMMKESATKSTNRDESISLVDVNLAELQEAVTENAQQSYTVEYLDTFTAHGQSRFSVVFRKMAPVETCVMKCDVPSRELLQQVTKWQKLGYVPSIIAGYSNEDKLHFAVLWTMSDTVSSQD